MPYVDRTVFTSNDQSSGQVADPNLLESNDKHIADIVDANYKELYDFVNGDNISKLGIVNVKDYGAKGDGSTDDTEFIKTAISDLGDTAHLFFPKGIYLLSEKINVSDKSVIISGSGIENTILKWSDSAIDEGWYFSNSHSNEFVSIKNMTLETEKAGVGDAITLDRTGEASFTGEPNTLPRTSIEGVLIKGVTNKNTDGWLNGVKSLDAMRIEFSFVFFDGYHGGTPSTAVSESFVTIDGPNDPVEFSIMSCWAFACQDAIKIRGAVEGVHITNSNFVNVNDGVDWSSSSTKPLLTMVNSHINAHDACVRLSGVTQFIINGNLLYKRPDSTANGDGVIASNCGWGMISNNNFYSTTDSYNFDCVVLNGSTSNISVKNNNFQKGTSGIKFESNTSGCEESNNKFGVLTNTFIDNSTNNIKNNGVYTSLQRSSSFSIPDSVQTIMEWNQETKDEMNGADLTSFPTRITIPNGVNEVNLIAGIVWGGNNTGERRIEFLRNGSPINEAPKIVKTASSNSSDYLYAPSINVDEGDYLEVRVRQDTGTSLNVLSDQGTFLKVIVANNQ